MPTNNPFPQPICEQIWNDKYRLITPNLNILDDMSVFDTWDRIARACAEAPFYNSKHKLTDEQRNDIARARYFRYKEALTDFGFLPAGRITAGAGSGRNVTLFNCYVMGTIPDSMGGIFDMLKEAALTMQQGGGIGYDFTPLRPKDAPVKGVDADASGPLTFMDVWDSMCRTVMSAGSRRGAMMATLQCDHPDIEAFITAKRDPLRLRMFNVSVLATDLFMEAVENDWEWPLVHEVAPAQPVYWSRAGINTPELNGKHIYKIIRAKDLWKLMMESTYNYAEPGVIFIDRINQANNLWYAEHISATNPCGEQPLPPYGACLLGSINLTQVVRNPFSSNSDIDYGKLEFLVEQAVEMLDAVIDISNFPIPQQKVEALTKRRMGLGVTGLANMLFMLDMEYGTTGAADFAEHIMKEITFTAYKKSIELAKLYGPCPITETKVQRQNFINSGFMRTMPESIRDLILEHGIRNSHLTSIAPTGTISLYAGNISSGVEPVFAPAYTRKVLEKDGTKREELIEDYGIKLWRERSTDPNLQGYPDTFVTAQTLSPDDHLRMQAAVQRWVDSSISKTINCPVDISFEEFSNVYLEAYKLGCKGCTTYRPNAVTGSILSIQEEPKPEQEVVMVKEQETPIPVHTGSVQPIARSPVLNGETYKLKWNDSNYYVTINNSFDRDGRVIPFEIFINTQDMGPFQWTTALTRMMSSVFRRGGNIDFVIEDLKSIMDPNGGAWVNGKYVPSFIALLGSTLEEHLKYLSQSDIYPNLDDLEDYEEIAAYLNVPAPIQCPACKGFNVHMASGCGVCGDCGHSKCS